MAGMRVAGARGRLWAPGAVAIVALALAPAQARAACPGADASVERATDAELRAAVTCLANAERARHGLPAVAAESRLESAALGHVDDMLARGYWSHVAPAPAPRGAGPGDRARSAGYAWHVIGENLAAGIATPREAVALWLASQSHCAALLSPEIAEMGVGVRPGTPGDPGRRSVGTWAQLLARPLGTPPPSQHGAPAASCPHEMDSDGDGVPDARLRDGSFESDNCPDTPNSGQADRDRDGRGDACEGQASRPFLTGVFPPPPPPPPQSPSPPPAAPTAPPPASTPARAASAPDPETLPRAALQVVVRRHEGRVRVTGRMAPNMKGQRIVMRSYRGGSKSRRVIRTLYGGRIAAYLRSPRGRGPLLVKVTVSSAYPRYRTKTVRVRFPAARR